MKSITQIIIVVVVLHFAVFSLMKAQTASIGYATPTANKGNAVLVFFFTGDDDPLYKIAQGVGNNISNLFDGYDYKVLLKFDVEILGFELNKAAEKSADVVDTPTMENLQKYLKKLTSAGYIIDIYIIGHGSRSGWYISSGTYSSPTKISSSVLKSSLSSSMTGYTKLPIRMVYQMICWGKNMNTAWQDVGAKVVIGAKYVNFYANQMNKFARKWNDGESFESAYEKSNTSSSRTVVQTWISVLHAPTHKSEWGSCPIGSFVLGKKDCAKDYFTTMWHLNSGEWVDSYSGKENMNKSSEMTITGVSKLKKKTKPKW